jgi:hypothetical protein
LETSDLPNVQASGAVLGSSRASRPPGRGSPVTPTLVCRASFQGVATTVAATITTKGPFLLVVCRHARAKHASLPATVKRRKFPAAIKCWTLGVSPSPTYMDVRPELMLTQPTCSPWTRLGGEGSRALRRRLGLVFRDWWRREKPDSVVASKRQNAVGPK